MAKPIRVGIIGANTRGGWARGSHVPAVQLLSGLELAAIATNSQATADAAATAFGVAKAFPSGRALIDDPEIDLVTVATRVPEHRELVLAAVEAGKHVYSEWPLGLNKAEAGELAEAATSARVRTAVGLQLRASPQVKRAQELIQSGAIGRVLGLSTSSTTAGFGPNVAPPFVYLEDPANFANLVTIQGAHTLDLAIAIGGSIDSFTALLTARYGTIRLGESAEKRARTTFDHLLLQGRFESQGTLAIEVAGGRSPDSPFWMEVVGDSGVLRLAGGAPRGAQSSVLDLSLNGEPQDIPTGELNVLPASAVNVGGVYASLRDDIVNGTANTVGFDHAVLLTGILDDVFESWREGRRAKSGQWPRS